MAVCGQQIKGSICLWLVLMPSRTTFPPPTGTSAPWQISLKGPFVRLRVEFLSSCMIKRLQRPRILSPKCHCWIQPLQTSRIRRRRRSKSDELKKVQTAVRQFNQTSGTRWPQTVLLTGWGVTSLLQGNYNWLISLSVFTQPYWLLTMCFQGISFSR